MKRIVSLFLVCSLLFSFNFFVFADNDFKTEIVYEGITVEYKIDVPVNVEVGKSADVSISGYWPTDMIVNISAPKSVELTSTSNSEDKIKLDIIFNDISVTGKGSSSVSITETLSVEDVTKDVFGIYKGYIVYDVKLNDVDNVSMTNEEAEEYGFTFVDYEGGLQLNDFTNEKSLTEIVIPAYVDGKPVLSIVGGGKGTKIENGRSANYSVFYGEGIREIILPNTLKFVDDGAFLGCASLESVNIPNGVTSVGKWAFRECNGLISIKIPNSVTSIGYGAFYKCESLTSITIPSSVTIMRPQKSLCNRRELTV